MISTKSRSGIGSEFEKATMPLTRRLWEMCEDEQGKRCGILRYWAPYARKYPHKVMMQPA